MSLKDKRIFIIEDNLQNRAIAETLLHQQSAVTAFDRWGVDTIHKLELFAPVDIILLDLMFPRGVTGYDVFQQIRNHEQFAHVPIVAVSASDPNEAIPQTRDMGFAGFIAKPIDFVKFTQQIATILAGQEVWSAS
jgi:CheY-like chemotaxis protein